MENEKIDLSNFLLKNLKGAHLENMFYFTVLKKVPNEKT